MSNTSPAPKLPKDTQNMLDSLRQTAQATLDRKKRLGQYAVIWENGQPWIIDANGQKKAAKN